MNYIGILTTPLILAIAALSMMLMARLWHIDLPSDRNAPIEGLRGYAALLVYVSHAASWFYFVRTGHWASPPLHVYSNLGTAAVIMFFMITAFLFTTKLLDATERHINWLHFAVSRVLRLAPMYLFSLLLILLIVALASGFVLKVSIISLVAGIAHWMAFTVLASPDLNAVKDTWLINAGVAWSLRYEVFFYLAYPAFGLVFLRGRMPNKILALVLGLLAVYFLVTQLRPLFAVPFIGGCIAAFAAKQDRWRIFAASRLATCLAVATLTAALILFPLPFGRIPLVLYAIVFSLVAAGNTLAGSLTWRAVRQLGEISYSVYLLHAIVLYVVVEYVLGREGVASMSAGWYWLMIAALTPLLVLLCGSTFAWIERPGMRSVAPLMRRLTRSA